MIGTSDGEDHPLAHPPAPRRADHRLLDAGRRLEHPRRGRPLVPRPRDQGADPELGQPALERAELLPDPAVADGVAGPRRPARDARVQPARRRSARRVRPTLVRVAPDASVGDRRGRRGPRRRRVRVQLRSAAPPSPEAARGADHVHRARAAAATSTTRAGCARTRASATRACSPTRICACSGGSTGRARSRPVRRATRFASPRAPATRSPGSVDGSAVKDSCDAADEEPGWSGTTLCKTALDTAHERRASPPGRRSAAACAIDFRGPVYQQPRRAVPARHPERPARRRRRARPGRARSARRRERP